MQSAEIVSALLEDGLAQDELARRAGVARETLSRWKTGAQHPSLEALEHVAAAAGFQLDVRLLPAEAKLVSLVHEQLNVNPADRLRMLLGSDWPRARDGLRAAALVGDRTVLVGPLAAALHGAPQRPAHGRVDLLVPRQDREFVSAHLLAAGVVPDGIEQASDGSERRERWIAGRGELTLRGTASGADVLALRDRAQPKRLSPDRVDVVRVALVEDLAQIAACSPWGEDAVYRAGLRAVLASGRYSTRHVDAEQSQLA